MAYDRTINVYDEPHPPVVLAASVAKRDINKGKFLTQGHAESYLCQMRTIHALPDVASCFEVGPGEHFVARNLRALGYTYDTLDFEPAHDPTIVADFATFDPAPYTERYDLACAFQVLEHFPFDDFPHLLGNLAMLARRYVFISLPYSCVGMSSRVTIHHGQTKQTVEEHHHYTPTMLPNRRYRPEFVTEFPWAVHHWEIGREGFPLERVEATIRDTGLDIVEAYHSPNPFHYHILCRRH